MQNMWSFSVCVCVAEAEMVCNEFGNAALHISRQRNVQVSSSSVSFRSHKVFPTKCQEREELNRACP